MAGGSAKFQGESIRGSQSESDPETIAVAKDVFLIARGAGIVYIGTIISGGLRYLFQVLVARHINVELFGLFSLGLAVFGVAEAMASLGMDRGVIRYVSLYLGEGDRDRVKGTIILAVALSLGGSLVLGLLLIALAKVLATAAFKTAELTNVLKLFAVAIPFSTLTTILLSSTQASRVMRYKVYVKDLFELLSRIALALVAFLLGWRLWGAVFAFVASIATGTLLSFFLYRKVFYSMLKDSVRPVFELGKLVAFCWPFSFASGFYLMEAWISIFVLGYFATPEAVGIFSAAYKTSLLAQGILLSFNTVFAPIISALYHREEYERLGSLFKLVTKWVFSLSFPAILLMIIFPQEILAIFGQDFAAGAISLIILSAGQFINSASGPLGVMIDMSGRSKIALFNSVLHFLLQISLCLILIPRYGVVGAALAKTVSIGFLRAIRLLQVRLILRMHPFRVEFLKPLGAGAASWLILHLIRTPIMQTAGNSIWSLVLGFAVFLGLYGLILYWLGFDDEDRMVFQKVRARLVS